MNPRKHQFNRFSLLAAALILVLAAYLGVLFSVQILHHQTYLDESSNSITLTETVTAARGSVTDRNGRTLITSRPAYSLTFDPSLLDPEEDLNLAVLRLVELCREQGVSWEDNLPISMHRPFFYTLDSVSVTQKVRFLSYLRTLKPAAEALNRYLAGVPSLLADLRTPENAGKDDLELLPGSRLSATLLEDAGISAQDLLDWIRSDMGIPEDLRPYEGRMVAGVRYELQLRSLGTNLAYIFAEDIDTAFISQLSDGDYAGARVIRTFTREYETDRAAHILGYVSRLYSREELEGLNDRNYHLDDWIGREGAEAAFESYLRGRDGVRVVSTNEEGRVTGEYYSEPPEPGNTVELTIDLPFQSAVEDLLAETVASMNEKDGIETRGGAAAVIRVGTGEVLALANYPTYDPNSYREHIAELSADPAQPLFNRATRGTYAPGSTLKPATAVAALQSGVVGLKERVNDRGKWTYPGYPQSYTYCWRRSGHGPLNITQAITRSCNYFFAEMGYRLGLKQLNDYLYAFGLGRTTDIEIGDVPGSVTVSPQGVDLAPWAAFGQANQHYTPLQLANYIATLVSGGKHCDAHLLKEARSATTGDVIATGNTAPSNLVDIDESTLSAVKTGMYELTRGTLAAYFRNCVVDAGAKTGTAQLGSDVENNGVFVCFAPYDEPEIALAIVIEKGGSGAALASTAVNIINAYFDPVAGDAAVPSENQLLP